MPSPAPGSLLFPQNCAWQAARHMIAMHKTQWESLWLGRGPVQHLSQPGHQQKSSSKEAGFQSGRAWMVPLWISLPFPLRDKQMAIPWGLSAPFLQDLTTIPCSEDRSQNSLLPSIIQQTSVSYSGVHSALRAYVRKNSVLLLFKPCNYLTKTSMGMNK